MKGKFVKMFALRFVSILLLSGMLALVPATAQASSDDGLVAEWHFDEGSGSAVADSSGNGNDGTIYGATWVDGKYGKALHFDGVNDYLDCGNDNSLKMGTNSFTLEAWIKTSTTKRMGIVGNYADELVWMLAVKDDGTVGMQSNTGDWNTGYALSTKTMTDGDWHHLVGTREYGGKIKIYIDSIFEAERDDDSANHNVNRYVVIGDEGLGKSKYFDGIIDEVRIYNRALTANEIKENYEGKQPVNKPTEEVPVGIDSDGDGWSDEREREMGTNPYSIDSDGDGIKDSEDPNPNVPEKKTPGFKFILTITGLLVVAHILRNNKIKR